MTHDTREVEEWEVIKTDIHSPFLVMLHSTLINRSVYKPSGEEVEIEALDNYYGSHQYGYRTSDGTVYNQDGFERMFTPTQEDV